MILEIEFLCMICTMIVSSAVSTPIFRNMPFLQSRLQFANEIAMLLLCLLTIFIIYFNFKVSIL